MTEPISGGPDDRPQADWRSRERGRRRVDTGTVIWGLILIAVGGWFFLDQTLGLNMPNIDWGDVWPIILVVVGAAVVLQGLGRRSS